MKELEITVITKIGLWTILAQNTILLMALKLALTLEMK